MDGSCGGNTGPAANGGYTTAGRDRLASYSIAASPQRAIRQHTIRIYAANVAPTLASKTGKNARARLLCGPRELRTE
jgi:hypothetical protein